VSRIQVVSQVGITSIGFDEARLHVDIDMRPTDSEGDWLQRRGRCGRAYPAINGNRDYQETGIEAMRRELAAKRNPVYVLGCGGGKSYMAGMVAAAAGAKGRSVGLLTVRRVLVDDISNRFSAMGVQHGVIMAGRQDNEHRSKVASAHTVAARNLTLNVDVLFVDEGHQYVAGEFRAILDRHANIPRVILTATPIRADGLGLGRIADSIILGPTTQELINRGFLVPTRIFCRHAPDVSQLRRNSSGEFNERENEEVMGRSEIVGDCVKEWLYRARNLPTIVHAVSIKHSLAIVKRFQGAGVNAVHVDADTPDDERKRVFDDMCRDAPPKKHSLLIDLAGNSLRFGFPEDHREWSLDDWDPTEPKPAALAIRRCEQCWCVFRTTKPECPQCGDPYVPTQREIKERKAELVERQREAKDAAVERWRKSQGDDERRARYMALVEKARTMGYKPNWAAVMLNKTTGHWPKKEWK